MSVEKRRPRRRVYRKGGYVDAGLAPRRVKGTIAIRTGPIDVDDTILIWEKPLGDTAP